MENKRENIGIISHVGHYSSLHLAHEIIKQTGIIVTNPEEKIELPFEINVTPFIIPHYREEISKTGKEQPRERRKNKRKKRK